MTATATPAPLRRDHSDKLVGGVCAALAGRLQIDPIIVRLAFVLATLGGGAGAAIYLVAWIVIPSTAAEATVAERERRGGDGSWQIAIGLGLLLLSGLLVLRALGIWFSDALVWPSVLAGTGAVLMWRRVAGARLAEMNTSVRGAAVAGAALVVGGGLVFLWLNDALAPARDVVLAVVVVLAAAALILAPWWLRLARGLSAERSERIRSQERSEVAAHLHDSVLQTLALVQKRADDPRAVATLARRQERELRAWLGGVPAPGTGGTLVAALEDAAADVEQSRGVVVDVVAVGDCPLDERVDALVGSAREAMLNAAKFAADAGPVSVYAEVGPDRIQVFVRDRGPGFDVAAIDADRRGVRESIIGRMQRHGGTAAIACDGGTEVELTLGRRR